MSMLSSDLCHLEQKSASPGVHLLQIVALTLEMQKFGGPPLKSVATVGGLAPVTRGRKNVTELKQSRPERDQLGDPLS